MSGEGSALIQLGAIGAPFGVRGWVKLRSDTDPPQRLMTHRVWHLNLNGSMGEYRLEASGGSGTSLTAKLAGIDDRDAAARLRGAAVYVPRSELPAPAGNEYYRADLIGCEALSIDGERLGVVGYFVETSAHAVMVVENDAATGAAKTLWVPALPKHIRRVDLDARRIWIEWSEDAA